MANNIADLLKAPEVATLVATAGAFVALVSIGAGWLIARRFATDKRLVWAASSVNLVAKTVAVVKDLTVIHDGEPIPTLSLTRVAVWSAGTQTINNTDLDTADPLAITTTDGARILSTEVVGFSDPATAFDIGIEERRRKALIRFKFLDKMQGAVVQIAHTGASGRAVTVTGRIRGVRKITRARRSMLRQAWVQAKVLVLMWVISLAIGVVLAVVQWGLQRPGGGIAALNYALIVSVFVAAVALVCVDLHNTRIPSSLEIVYSDVADPLELAASPRLRRVPVRREPSIGTEELTIVGVIREALPPNAVLTDPGTGQRAEALIQSERRRVAVSIAPGRGFDGDALLGKLVVAAASTNANGVLLVVNGDRSHLVDEFVRRYEPRIGVPVAVVYWSSDDLGDALGAAVRRLLSVSDSVAH